MQTPYRGKGRERTNQRRSGRTVERGKCIEQNRGRTTIALLLYGCLRLRAGGTHSGFERLDGRIIPLQGSELRPIWLRYRANGRSVLRDERELYAANQRRDRRTGERSTTGKPLGADQKTGRTAPPNQPGCIAESVGLFGQISPTLLPNQWDCFTQSAGLFLRLPGTRPNCRHNSPEMLLQFFVIVRTIRRNCYYNFRDNK